jgi:hypothetical protein
VRAAEGVVRIHGRPAPEWSAPEPALRRAPFSALSGCAGQGREVFTGALLSEVYRQPVEVVPHPRTGAVLVTPERGAVTAERDT